MGSTNVPNKKQVKNERDNPTSANMQTVLTGRGIEVPENTVKGKTHDLGPTEYDINLGSIELVASTCELGKDNILRDAHGNPVIAMQKGSYQTVKESQTKRSRYTRTKRTVQRVDETR